MDKKKKTVSLIVFACVALILMIGTIIVKSPGSHESISELMRDAFFMKQIKSAFLV